MTEVNLTAAAVAHATARATMRMKHHFSQQHICAAALFASLARKYETEHCADKIVANDVSSTHRAYVSASIFSAVAFLESSINELFLSAPSPAEDVRHLFLGGMQARFEEKWKTIERSGVLSKCNAALELAGKPLFESDSELYKDTDAIIKLRNCMVHYEPEWDDEKGKHYELKDRLDGRFEPNQLLKTSSLWFPHICLGAGCAGWGVATVKQFWDEFCRRLEISLPMYLDKEGVMDDRELKWKKFEMDVTLFKGWMELLLKFNTFYYAITGALLSYYLVHKTSNAIRFSLLFPLLMSAFFSVFLFYSAKRAGQMRASIKVDAEGLNFTTWPEANVLVAFLYISAGLCAFIALGIGFLFLFGSLIES